MSDVENKIARTIRAIADKGAARRPVGVNVDAADVDVIPFEPLEIDSTKIIVANGRDQRNGLANSCGLISENGGGPRREGTCQWDCLKKSVALRISHDFHEDFADNQYLLHLILLSLWT